ncbi:hypothetical protein C8T65DRAFT_213677 [Cerioporus squamosus]|nr:hypothetical protein C8T65DRAFT_213677 [Cerioporus squamosus]
MSSSSHNESSESTLLLLLPTIILYLPLDSDPVFRRLVRSQTARVGLHILHAPVGRPNGSFVHNGTRPSRRRSIA